MLTQEQFDGLLKFSSELLTEDAKAQELIAKAGLTSDQLKVIAIMVAYSIRAYDALKSGGEFVSG